MRQDLELQADRIETVLSSYGAPGRVTGGTVTPRWSRFQVIPAMGTRISTIKSLESELAAALDRSTCRVARRGAAVSVEIPRLDPRPVTLLRLMDQLDPDDLPPVTALLGLDEDGGPLLIRLPSPDVAHVLVSGTTGSGKTALLRAMIMSLVTWSGTEEVRVVIIDPKGEPFSAFEALPHLPKTVREMSEDPAHTLKTLALLMERRDGRSWVGNEPNVVVVIDELADILTTSPDSEEHLTRLLQRGRSAGIHVVAATQKPSASVLGPLTKANFPVRLVGKVTSPSDARVASGWSGTGAERLTGRGDFVCVAEGKVTRFQAAYATESEIAEAVASIAAAVTTVQAQPAWVPARIRRLP